MLKVDSNQRAVRAHQLKQKIVYPLAADAPSETVFYIFQAVNNDIFDELTKYHLWFRTSAPSQLCLWSE